MYEDFATREERNEIGNVGRGACVERPKCWRPCRFIVATTKSWPGRRVRQPWRLGTPRARSPEAITTAANSSDLFLFVIVIIIHKRERERVCVWTAQGGRRKAVSLGPSWANSTMDGPPWTNLVSRYLGDAFAIFRPLVPAVSRVAFISIGTAESGVFDEARSPLCAPSWQLATGEVACFDVGGSRVCSCSLVFKRPIHGLWHLLALVRGKKLEIDDEKNTRRIVHRSVPNTVLIVRTKQLLVASCLLPRQLHRKSEHNVEKGGKVQDTWYG
jgi:hypothetical protein